MQNTDILFIVPAIKKRIKEESIGSLILAKKAQLAGFHVDIARYWNVDPSPKSNYTLFSQQFVDYIIDRQSKIVSFYCRCEEYHICIDLSRKIKERSPKTIICFGGPQAELVAKDTIRRFSHVDYVCCSEGENTIVPLLNLLIKKEENTFVAGLTYRNDKGEVLQNTFPNFLKDNYSRKYYYYDLMPQDVFLSSDSMPIDVGRGCPFSCTYCSTKTFWKRKFRLRNIQDIVDEIEYVNNTYGIQKFDFMHDLFTVNKKRIVELCHEFDKRDIKVKWGCDSRIDTIDYEMIDIMVANGLFRIFFGIETGSDRMQQLINKKLNLKRCDEIIKYCLSKGLEVTTSFIYGFPKETEEDLTKTMEMAVRFQNYGCTVLTNMCHIMNGTELFDLYKERLFIEKSTSYNACIWGFDELFQLIANNMNMFANFCDFPNPFRDEMKFFDVFRYTLNYAKNNFGQEHALLQNKKYASLEMYRLFCESNKDVFFKLIPPSDGNVSNIKHILKYGTSENVYKLMITNLINSYNNEESI